MVGGLGSKVKSLTVLFLVAKTFFELRRGEMACITFSHGIDSSVQYKRNLRQIIISGDRVLNNAWAGDPPYTVLCSIRAV